MRGVVASGGLIGVEGMMRIKKRSNEGFGLSRLFGEEQLVLEFL